MSTAERPLVLLLDGLNQLCVEHRADRLNWLPSTLPANVHLVLSTTTDHSTHRALLAMTSWLPDIDRQLDPVSDNFYSVFYSCLFCLSRLVTHMPAPQIRPSTFDAIQIFDWHWHWRGFIMDKTEDRIRKVMQKLALHEVMKRITVDCEK